MDTDRSTTAVVPLRAPGSGKTRLAPRLTVEQRAALAGAMLADVCHALEGAAIDRIVVAAGGASAVAAASALGLDVLHDPPRCSGLDAALRAAVGRIGDAGTLLIVTADLPGLTAEDITAVLERPEPVVVAPTDDGGTGALLRRPPDAIATAYGPGSAARHLGLAYAAGLPAATIRRHGLAHDLDTWDDLRRLRAGPLGPATAAVLVGMALPASEVG
jgi:2-phospho-L-lactate/phosphoenolpyruvate guanylyltransferase